MSGGLASADTAEVLGEPDAFRRRLARWWFLLQAASGASWWIGVAVSDDVRRWTLDPLPALLVAPFDVVLFVVLSWIVALTMRAQVAWIVTGWSALMTLVMLGVALFNRTGGWGAIAMIAATVGSGIASSYLTWGRAPTERLLLGPFAFRRAPQRSVARNVVASVTQLVIFWVSFFAAIPLLARWFETRARIDWPGFGGRATTWVALGVFLLASMVAIAACWSMSRFGAGTPLPSAMPNRLVVRGPYRWVRNPMALAGAVQTASVGVMLGSWIVIALALAGALAWNEFIRPHEEADLAANFGADFAVYVAEVRCWVPRATPVAPIG